MSVAWGRAANSAECFPGVAATWVWKLLIEKDKLTFRRRFIKKLPDVFYYFYHLFGENYKNILRVINWNNQKTWYPVLRDIIRHLERHQTPRV